MLHAFETQNLETKEESIQKTSLTDDKDYNLTESLSSITRWGLAGVAGLVPFILLYCVNKIFMVARRTSDKLCLIYAKKKRTQGNEEQVNMESLLLVQEVRKPSTICCLYRRMC